MSEPQSSAEISECGQYRYALRRRWGPEAMLVFVMLNPSTADAAQDDPTIRKCVGFAKRFGFGGIRVVNLFALRSPRPSAILRHADPVGPVGPEGDEWILRETSNAREPVIVAWGAHSRRHQVRVARVIFLIGRGVRALRTLADGTPEHPLMLPYSCCPEPWAPGAG